MRTLTIPALALALTLAPSAGDARSDQHTQSGEPVRWHRAALPFVLDPSVTDAATLPRPLEVIERAAGVWRGIANAPRVNLVAGSLGPPGYDPVRRENNVSGITVYRNGFPVRMERPVLAVTLVTRDSATGEIYDADILVDAWRNRFAVLSATGITGDANAPNDWQNVLTHEFGHALGLTEDFEHNDATMYPSSLPGEVRKRDLDGEDRASITGAYAAAIDGQGPVYPAGCGGARVSPRSPSGGPAWALLAVACLGLAAWRVRRRGAVGFAAMGGFFLVLAVPSPQPKPVRPAEVVRVDTRREGGMILTRAVLREGGQERVVELPGGRHEGLVQTAYDTPSGDGLNPGATVDAEGMSAP